MNKLVLLFFLLGVEVSLAQTTQFSVSYHGKPACNTTFTITDTLNREIGSGKSDGSGNFSCECIVAGVYILKAKPDNGSKWSLRLFTNPFFNATPGQIDIRIEEIEAQFNQVMEMQDDVNDGVEDSNNSINKSTGSNSGTKEVKILKGFHKVAKKAVKVNFVLIRASIEKSCLNLPVEEIKTGVAMAKDGQRVVEESRANNKAETETPARENEEKGAEKDKIKAEKEETEKTKKAEAKEQKEKEEEQKRLEADKKEEQKRLKAEKKAEQKREEEEQKKLQAEKEKERSKNKIYTPEELDQMSTFNLKSLKMQNKMAVGTRKTDLKVHGSMVKEPKRQEIQAEIDELEKQIEAVKAVLQKRKEKAD